MNVFAMNAKPFENPEYQQPLMSADWKHLKRILSDSLRCVRKAADRQSRGIAGHNP
jgi:hypothetical protein